MKIRTLIAIVSTISLFSCGGENNKDNGNSTVPERQVYKIEMGNDELGIDISEDVDISISGDGNQIYIFSTSSFNALLLQGSNNILYLYSSESMNLVSIAGDDNIVFMEGPDDIVSIESGLGNSIVNSDDLSVNESNLRVTIERNGRQFDSEYALPGL